MTRKLRILKRVHETKKRIRDVAAGAAAAADAQHQEAVRAEEGAAQVVDEILDETTERIETASAAGAFELMEHERRVAHHVLVEAQRESAKAEEQCERARDALRVREREVRRTERLLEQGLDRLEIEMRRGEQKLNDDLSGRRRGSPA